MRFISFGSVNRDIVYWVPHIVHEGETISSSQRAEYWGGKGQNQCVALARAGAEAFLAARISKDDLPHKENLLELFGVDGRYVGLSEEPTGHALIQVSQTGENSIIVYPGANYTMSEAFIQTVLDGFSPGDVVLLQNEINLVDVIIREAKKRKLIVVLNPSPYSDSILNWPLDLIDLFIVNETECAAFCGEARIEAMLKKFPTAEIVLTLGSKGASFMNRQTRLDHGIYQTHVVDTTAAGDTFTGYFLYTYYTTHDAAAALDAASKAAAIAVSKHGAVPSIPSAAEVRETILTQKPRE